jgi:tetratricopeptide (TPR) repeat protein
VKANFVIDRVADMENISTDLEERIIGEAKFLRALFYFNGVRLFGGLPIILEPSTENLNVTRSSEAQTYAQIISDLNDAVEVLPERYDGGEFNEVGRATKGAALGILAKVYLNQGEYALAEAAASEVTRLNYDLNPNYWQNFEPINENDMESVFEVQFSAGAGEDPFGKKHQGSWPTEFTNPRGSGISPGGGYGWGHVTQEFVSSYAPGDERLSVTVWRDGDSYAGFTYSSNLSSTGYNIKKWVRGSQSVTATDSDLNIPVLRYSDVLLVLAEAINEQGRPGDAEQYINDVRDRAGLSALSDLTQAEMREAIMEERRLEFAFEGKWWFDLMRAGPDYAEIYFEDLGITNFDKTKHILMPIPQTDMDLNPNLEQNPNY